MASEIKLASILVVDVPTGGYLDVVDTSTGEVLHQFFVPVGRHRYSKWLTLLQPWQELQTVDGVVCFQLRSGVNVQQHPAYLKSDANPSFVVTSADRMAREMREALAEIRNERLAIQKLARKKQADLITTDEVIPQGQAEAEGGG